VRRFTHRSDYNSSPSSDLLACYSSSGQLSAIETIISNGAPLNIVLRLLCLASITSTGIKQKTLEGLKREILQTYGYDELPTLLSLSNSPLSLITPLPRPASLPPAYPHTQLRKFLRLLIDAEEIPSATGGDDRDQDEPDISYVYSGWAPLSVRLVQCVTQKGGVFANPNSQHERKQHQKANSGTTGEGNSQAQKSGPSPKAPAHPITGWKGFEDIVELVPGDTFDIPISGDVKEKKSLNGQLANSRSVMTTTVLFFLGGVTYTEIAAIRWMARQNIGRRYLIATTGIVSGDSLMDSIAHKR